MAMDRINGTSMLSIKTTPSDKSFNIGVPKFAEMVWIKAIISVLKRWFNIRHVDRN